MKNSKSFNFPTASILMLTLALAMSGNARAQVTIGENLEPQSFSVLELISNNTMGMRLPQMDSVQRNEMMGTQAFKDEIKGKALGLQIFNTSTKCVNTWNGVKWIEQCAPVTFPNSVIFDGINITTFVNVMYDFQYQEMYVYDTVSSPVSYQWFAKRLGQANTEYKAISGAKSATYTIPVNFVKNVYQPMVKDSDTDYNDSIMFACVAEYADGTFKTASMDILFIGTNTSGYGIDANGVRYLTLKRGKDGEVQGGTMKVALLNLGQSATWNNSYTSNNNAGDLGDYYQWGRVADGHQNIVWSKDATHVNQWKPTTGGENTSAAIYYNNCTPGESDASCIPTIFPVYNSVTHQIVNDYHYGKFIYSWSNYTADPYRNGDKDWYFECTGIDPKKKNCYHNDGLWGVAAGRDRAAQGSLSFEWNIPDNNPCPSGWRIPSVWNWWDIISGNGSDEQQDETSLPSVAFLFPKINYGSATNNNWQRRHASSNNNAYGGVIITNIANEKIFLPWIAHRQHNYDEPMSSEIHGLYWSSTGLDTTYPNGSHYINSSSYTLDMLTTYFSVNMGSAYERERGLCARCVKE